MNLTHREKIMSDIDLKFAQRPEPEEYNAFYQTYMDCVEDRNIFEQLENQVSDLREILDTVSPDVANEIHEPYTWTIKQVIGHMIDAEKIFGSRLHRFGCGDLQPVPGMDHLPYVSNMEYDQIPLASLTDELESTRRSNLAFVKRLPPSAWDNSAAADGNLISVRALVYILVGHINHHLKIVRKRIA